MKNEDKKKLEESYKRIKVAKKIIIGIDVLALILLIIQIVMKEVSIPSYIVLIVCNILVFLVKQKEE